MFFDAKVTDFYHWANGLGKIFAEIREKRSHKTKVTS